MLCSRCKRRPAEFRYSVDKIIYPICASCVWVRDTVKVHGGEIKPLPQRRKR